VVTGKPRPVGPDGKPLARTPDGQPAFQPLKNLEVAAAPYPAGTEGPAAPTETTGGEGEGGPAAPAPEPAAGTAQVYETRLPEESVIQGAQPTDAALHRRIFENTIHDDASREAALYRNDKTGEFIIVQGTEKAAAVETAGGKGRAPAKGGEAQRWKEILDQGSDAGHWELVAHSHPSGRSLPSITDLTIAVDNMLRTKQPQTGEIVVRNELEGLESGHYGYDLNDPEPYWIQPAGEPPQRFGTMQEYFDYLGRRYEVEPGPVPQRVLDLERQLYEGVKPF
jgi:hypothetical protein